MNGVVWQCCYKGWQGNALDFYGLINIQGSRWSVCTRWISRAHLITSGHDGGEPRLNIDNNQVVLTPSRLTTSHNMYNGVRSVN